MTWLPIVERELRVRARRRSTYRARELALVVSLLAALPILLLGSSAGSMPQGQVLFITATVLLFIGCLFEGVRQTFDCLSEERREGTLGLLFLTGLKHYDVVLGKLAAASIHSFFALLSVLPILGLSVVVGGVTGGEFIRMALVLINTLWFALAIGLWSSARSWGERQSLTLALACLLASLGVLPVLEALQAPVGLKAVLGALGYQGYLAFATNYSLSPEWFWLSLVIVQGLGWSFLWHAYSTAGSRRCDTLIDVDARPENTPRVDKGSEPVTHPRRSGIRRWFPNFAGRGTNPPLAQNSPSPCAEHTPVFSRKKLLDRNPLEWLSVHQCGSVKLLGWVIVSSLFVHVLQVSWQGATGGRGSSLVEFYVLNLVLSLVVWIIVASLVSRGFAEGRGTGALELLLSTPVTVKEIVHGHRLGLQRVLFRPMLIYILLVLITGYAYLFFVMPSRPVTPGYHVIWLMLNGANALAQGADLIAMIWVGMWLGIRTGKPARAAGTTFLLVTFLPFFLCSGFPMVLVVTRFLGPWGFVSGLYHPLLMLVKDGLLIAWAHRRLYQDFRLVVAGQPPAPFRERFLTPKKPWVEDFSPIQ